MSIDRFAILGERCSGTNFLEETILNNFNISYTTEYGHKHFFCYNNYNTNNSDNTLFIGIIRNPIYWINSFSYELHHVPDINRLNINNFLFNRFYSIEDEINEDKNSNNIFKFNGKFYTYKYKINTKDLNYINGRIYKNIFELRKVKNDFLINIMPNKVKNYILINYEDLLYNYTTILQTIKDKFNLIQKNDEFIKIKKYKKCETSNFVQQRKISLSPDIVVSIWQNLDKEQEKLLGYKMWDDNNYFKNKIK